MLADGEGVVLAEAQGAFMVLAPAVVDEILKDYPGLRDFPQ